MGGLGVGLGGFAQNAACGCDLCWHVLTWIDLRTEIVIKVEGKHVFDDYF